MALKIGRIEIGYRLLISLTAIAIAYGYLGSYLSILWKSDNYLIAGLLFVLAISGIFAIPQSLGGLLAAIASVISVYWQSNLIFCLITASICLVLYWLGFADIRYNPAPERKLSIIEIIATVITIALTIAFTISLFQIHLNWFASLASGAIAAAITLIGKQIRYLELRQSMNLVIIGILASSSLAIGFAIKLIFYTPKPDNFL